MKNSLFPVCTPTVRMVSILIIGLLSGCSRSNPYQDLEDYFKKIKEQQVQYTRKLHSSDVKLPAGIIYNGNLHRSPFSGLSETKDPAKAVASTNPLQAYSLSMLRLMGTVTENAQTVGYVSTPDNMVYRIQVGDMIGDHHGKVVSVQPGSVNVMELDVDNPGEQVQRIVTLKLRNEP